MGLKKTLIEPKIVEKKAFRVMGIMVYGNPLTINYDEVWRQFMSSYYDRIARRSTDKAYYNVYFNTDEDNAVELIAGMSVKRSWPVPKGLATREIPAARYAMFGCLINVIELTYGYIHNKWFPASKYEWDKSKPDFEYFSPGFSVGNIPVLIYIPIREKLISLSVSQV